MIFPAIRHLVTCHVLPPKGMYSLLGDANVSGLEPQILQAPLPERNAVLSMTSHIAWVPDVPRIYRL